MRGGVLEMAPREWVEKEHALLVGIVIGDADGNVAAVAGAALCSGTGTGTFADVPQELTAGMMTRLVGLVGDEAISVVARLGCARCVARDKAPETQKMLAKFLGKLPKRLSAAFKKQAQSER